MIADRKNNPFSAPWRVDCRLARELPDDKAVRSHFLVQLAAVLLCAVLLLVAGWQAFQLNTTRAGIARWVKTMADDRAIFDEVRRERAEIAADGRRIGEAASALQTRILTFDYLSAIGRTRPENLRIDQIESLETGLVLRGIILVSPEKASRQLGKYVADLRADPHLGPRFSAITLTAMDRRGEETELQFEITFRYH